MTKKEVAQCIFRMKYLVIAMTILVVILAPVQAQIENLTIYPDKVTIYGTTETSNVRTILFLNQNKENPITGISIITSDIAGTNNNEVFPEKNIEISTINSDIPAYGHMKIPISVSFLNVKSGEYSGSLFIRSDNGEKEIPVSLKIKDSPWVAATIAIVCGFLGWFLVFYKTVLLKPNQINDKRIRLIKKYQKSSLYLNNNAENKEYLDYFRVKIQFYLDEMKNDLENYNLTEYDQALTDALNYYSIAKKVLDNWNAHEKNWGDYLENTSSALTDTNQIEEKMDSEPAFTKGIKTRLNEAWSDAAENSEKSLYPPAKLDTLFKKLDENIATFSRTIDLIEKLNNLCNSHPSDDDKKTCLGAVTTFRQKLIKIPYSDEMNELGVLQEEIKKECEKYQDKKRGIVDAPGEEVSSPQNLKKKSPKRNFQPIFSWVYSQKMENIYFIIKMGVVPILLVCLGTWLQYVDNPIFGVKGIVDYITLGLWSFGVTPATDSLSEYMK